MSQRAVISLTVALEAGETSSRQQTSKISSLPAVGFPPLQKTQGQGTHCEVVNRAVKGRATLSPKNAKGWGTRLLLLTLDQTPECMLLSMRAASMQIGELAKRTALSIDAIRFYEKRELLPKAARSNGGFRLYSPDDVERLLFIRQIHGLGFSLREIRELVDLRTRKVDACETVRELLKRKLMIIRAKRRELEELETQLMTDLRKCNKELLHRKRHTAGACPVLEEVAE